MEEKNPVKLALYSFSLFTGDADEIETSNNKKIWKIFPKLFQLELENRDICDEEQNKTDS